VFGLNGTNVPVWIIRNGVNDLAQDVNTDFEKLGKSDMPEGTNGNGAVSFAIAADSPANPEDPQDGDLVIKDGTFVGPSNSSTPKIGFTTAGYDGTAGVYYAVVAAGADAPAYSAYTNSLGLLEAGDYEKQITLLGTADNDYDVYVIE
jgi:hypothetical protein